LAMPQRARSRSFSLVKEGRESTMNYPRPALFLRASLTSSLVLFSLLLTGCHTSRQLESRELQDSLPSPRWFIAPPIRVSCGGGVSNAGYIGILVTVQNDGRLPICLSEESYFVTSSGVKVSARQSKKLGGDWQVEAGQSGEATWLATSWSYGRSLLPIRLHLIFESRGMPRCHQEYLLSVGKRARSIF